LGKKASDREETFLGCGGAHYGGAKNNINIVSAQGDQGGTRSGHDQSALARNRKSRKKPKAEEMNTIIKVNGQAGHEKLEYTSQREEGGD